MEHILLPPLSIDLINKLNEEIPELCPDKEDSMEDIMFYSGQRSVVRKLLALKQEAEEQEFEGGF